MIGRDIVGHTIDPGPERAAAVETREATPKLEVDVLQEVLPLHRACLVACREPSERRAQKLDGQRVMPIGVGWKFRRRLGFAWGCSKLTIL